MSSQDELAARFLELHRPGEPLLMPNPWDVGTARILASLGFQALATTSSGHAISEGGLDGTVTREQAIAHGGALAAAVDVPVSADLENCFADSPEGVAETVRMAIGAGLAGCSIEDYAQREDDPIYELALAVERVAAAAQAAHEGDVHFVLTARAENHLRGRDDLDDTIARLRAYGEAGADVLYAPGIARAEDIRAVVESVGRPVNVLTFPGVPPIAELAELGVARVSVGSAFALSAIGALAEAAEEFRSAGTYGFLERSAAGSRAARAALYGSS
ncbi:MAG TPA: isocitrate lyase/phosphoenolpyruvate mutase family protein [Solirubrobacteraceae bacterium]